MARPEFTEGLTCHDRLPPPVRDKWTVKAGYEAIADAYTTERAPASEDLRLADAFASRLPRGGRLLDAGCGGGTAAAVRSSATVRVVGLDFARAQLQLFENRVPAASPVMGDMTHLPFRAGSFDGIVSLYAIIHVPREEHARLIREFHRVLRPSGMALLCMGEVDLPGDVAEYMGTEMFWSHFDAETNHRILEENGFAVLEERSVVDSQEPSASHRFFTVARG